MGRNNCWPPSAVELWCCISKVYPAYQTVMELQTDTHFYDSIGKLSKCGDNFFVRLTSLLKLPCAGWFRCKENRQKLAVFKFVNSEVQNHPSQELKNNPTSFMMWTNTDQKLLFNHRMICLGRELKEHLVPVTFHQTRLLQASSDNKFNAEIDLIFHFQMPNLQRLIVVSYLHFGRVQAVSIRSVDVTNL